jgi:hypothetical protein
MRVRIIFYLFLIALTLFDAVLLRSPNLLGKIGLLIYHYHYLRTFPKALLTVSIVVGVSAILGELIRMGVQRFLLKKFTGKLLLILFMMLSVTLLVKTGIDFSSGTYSQTGIRFRLGACLLPAILLVVFIFTWVTLPRIDSSLPEQPAQQ